MRSKVEILQEHFGTPDLDEVRPILRRDFMAGTSLPASSFTKMKLPYEASSHPGIPTMSEIEQAMKYNRLSHPLGGFDVCRVGMTVVKMGVEDIILQEAEDLLFLQENTQVRAPKLYAVFTQTEDLAPPYYMVTEFIEGETLDYEKWMRFSEDARTKICAKLSDQLQLLRSVPSEGYYGRVHRQGWRSRLSLLRIRGKEMSGPYSTYEEFFWAMYAAAEMRATMSTFTTDWCRDEEFHLSEFQRILLTCKGRQPTLTHMDPALKNIIVRRLQGTENDVEDWEVTLIDWADLGWYPAWMQAVAFSGQLLMMDAETGDSDDDAKAQFQEKVLLNCEEPYSEQMDLFTDMGEETGYRIM